MNGLETNDIFSVKIKYVLNRRRFVFYFGFPVQRKRNDPMVVAAVNACLSAKGTVKDKAVSAKGTVKN